MLRLLFVGTVLSFGAAQLGATESARVVTAEQRFADAANDICFRTVAGQIRFGVGIDDDTRLLNEAGLSFGVANDTVARMGKDGVGIISQAILGEQVVGRDAVVVAIGGRLPGCRAILLRSNASGTGEGVGVLLTSSGWKEATASNPPGANPFRRMFVRRDASGQPWLLNLYAGALPNSEIHLVATVWQVPANVVLPEGF